jgi:hypothetical protein
MTDDGWRMADGGWRLAAGGWRMAAGGWRLAALALAMGLGGVRSLRPSRMWLADEPVYAAPVNRRPEGKGAAAEAAQWARLARSR